MAALGAAPRYQARPTISQEPPLSLQRLRESLSSLEQLEQKRREIRDRCNTNAGDVLGHGMDLGFGLDRHPQPRPLSHSPPRWHSTPSPGLLRGPPALNSNPAVGGPSGGAVSGFVDERSPWRASLDPAASLTALALERSQERIEQLQRERDDARQEAEEAKRKTAEQEQEVARLAVLVDRSALEHRSLLEERRREQNDLQRARREERDATDQARESSDQVTNLREELQQARAAEQEWRDRFEQLSAEQRLQIDTLEESSIRAVRDLQEQSGRTVEVGGALYSCLHERTSLLRFLTDALSELQSLFCDPASLPPAVDDSRLAMNRRGNGQRASSQPCVQDRSLHSHSGCYACGVAPGGSALYRSYSPGPSGKQRQERVPPDAVSDLRELVRALEGEIAESALEYTAQVRRVASEADDGARCVQSAIAAGCSASPPPPAQGDAGVVEACDAWMQHERWRRERRGLPADSLLPGADWEEERQQHQVLTRSLGAKFAQLAKLRRVLRARRSASANNSAMARRRGCG